MSEQDPLQRHPRSLDEWVTLTFLQLVHIYCEKTRREFSEEVFEREMVAPLASYKVAIGDRPIDILLAVVPRDVAKKGEDEVAHFPLGMVILSTIYALNARAAWVDSRPDLAWSFLADARYWCGGEVGKNGISAVYDKSLKAARQAQAKAGGDGKSKRYDSLKETAYELVRSEALSSGAWPSRRQAVLAVKDKIVELSTSSDIKLNLSADQAEKTVDGWLKVMPDADKLFSRRGSSK